MHQLKRNGSSIINKWSSVHKSYNGLSSFMESKPTTKCVSDVGVAGFTSMATTERTLINGLPKWKVLKPSCTGQSIVVHPMAKDLLGATGIPVSLRRSRNMESLMTSHLSFQLMGRFGNKISGPSFARSFASKASESRGKNTSESRKDISTVEDPFDAPTYNIPEKPVTFTEGASYSLIILVGLGVAAAAAYGVFKELIFQPKEYKIFGKALERVQNDSQVRVRIGSPISGYGQESRNRAARQRIPNRVWTDEDGVEHVEVNFYIRGPHGTGKAYVDMFKDNVDKQWKYTYLIVEIMSPSPSQLILESYVPA